MNGLQDKLVVITGGARGIGFATAERFAQEGARLVLADINGDLAEESARALTAKGVECRGYSLDVGKVADVERFFHQIQQDLGGLDILINNAGVQIRHPSIDFPEADWDKLMNIDLKGPFFCAQSAAKLMREKKGGAIVNISSGMSTQYSPGRAPYTIAKAGINALTAVLAAEWASLGIRVNAVAPGWIMTDMVQDGMRLGVISERQLMSAIPFKRFADASEIADAVVYLASGDAGYVTGQTLFVDGGWSSLGLPDIR